MLFGTQRINNLDHLEIGGCDTVDLAEKFGTPLYVMDEKLLRQTCRDYLKSFRARYKNTEIAFAGKAFLTAAMCRIADQEGLHLDVVSAGELYTARKAGFPMERIYCHGNNKSEAELRMSLAYGVGRIVVDNLQELDLLSEIASETGQNVNILLRLTPGIDPHTHRLIRTGQADTKFGLNIKDGSAMAGVKKAIDLSGINLLGIHCHVGSQFLDLEAHNASVPIMVGFAKEVLDETGLILEEINTGGGLGIRYTESQQPPSIDQFADAITSAFKEALKETNFPGEPRLVQEPGRSITGPAGTTLYTIGTIKTVPITEEPGYRVYAAVDGGMSDNPRPLLYDAVYTPIAANKAEMPAVETITISGKHCETDTLILDAKLPKLDSGDTLAVLCTGAYNYSMCSNYNRFTKPAAVLVSDGSAEVIIERETLDDLVSHDVIPDRLVKR